MRTRFRTALLAVSLGVAATSLVACSQVAGLKAKMAFKDANALYQGGDYKKAAAKYEEAIQQDPNLTAAYFYLANSYDNLYKPARQGEAENDAYLQKAVEWYGKAADKSEDPKLKKLSLEYLVAAYRDKVGDTSKAEPIIERMIQMDPKDTANYFALAKIYEDAGNYEQAEAMLNKARDMAPGDSAVYMQLAGYYNRQGDFDKTMQALYARAEKEPSNPEAFYTIATYYWDKAFRDFRLKEADKRDYIQKGIDATDQALKIKADYMEAMVYKGLLLRLAANLEKDAGRQKALLKEADELRDKATALRKQKSAGAGAGAGN